MSLMWRTPTTRLRHPISARPLPAVLLLIGLTIGSLSLRAENRMRAPKAFSGPSRTEASYQTSTSKLLGTGLINLYSHFISPADGPRSPSYPTSTAYGKQAIERYGFFTGVILIADRLLHEADVPTGPIITLYGKKRFYDPVGNNTFWWDESCRR